MGAGTLMPEVFERRYKRVYICYRCGKKVRADAEKIKLGKVICPKCKNKRFRPIRTEIKLR